MKKNMSFSLLSILFLLFTSNNIFSNLKDCELWWSHNEKIFDKWLLDANSISRVKMRSHVKAMGYKSFLDIPCGHCTEYFGYQKDGINIDYYGVDVTKRLVDKARESGLQVLEGNIEDIPYEDSFFDVCYARHILEHLGYYEKAVRELIRVASKEVIVIFFIKPHKKADFIDYRKFNGYYLYHNRYNIHKLEKFVLSCEKVKNIEWENINHEENVLHIYLQR